MATTDYNKPLPVADRDTVPFWEALKRHEFVLRKCQECGQFHHPPRRYCPTCWSENVEWATASGNGTLYTYTIARREAHPRFKDAVPYVIAVIELAEGPRFLSNLVDSDIESLQIGLPVQIVYDDVTPEATLPKFKVSSD